MVSSTRSALRAIPRHLSRRSTALSALARPVASIPATCTSSASNAPFGSPCASALSQKRWGGSTPARSSKFAKITPEHIESIKALLSSPASCLSTLDGSATEDDLAGFNNDWLGKYIGRSAVVVKPKTTEEVSKVMKYCYENDIAVVPQGGNTGLVGGSNPVHDELILSLNNMNQVRSFDPVSGTLVADAGVVLETADHMLAEKGFIFPLDLGAKGSCHIGGNVATNAGGLRLLRYGSLHGSVLGLEVVLPDGRIWNNLKTLRKDNTGFDLKQLFIGSEGTIGIITAISILCPRRPKAMNVAVFSVPSYEGVQKVYGEAKGHLGEILSAFEFWDKQAFAVTQHHMKELHGAEKKVFETEGDFYCLIETGGSNSDHDEEKLAGLLEHLMESEMVLDGVLAQDQTQFASIWSLRELLPEACSKQGPVYKYDLSVPVGEMYSIVERMRERLREGGVMEGDGTPEGPIRACVGYGHMGDGNLHINIIADKWDPKVEKLIEPFVYEVVAEKNGSISAEHGLGVMKAPYIGYSQNETSVEMMRQIKNLFDPKGLLNPYKYVQ